MNPYMAYDAVNTKIVTQKGRILDEKNFEKMMECNTVEQVTEMLFTQYGFREFVDHTKIHDLHRDDLETLLNSYKPAIIENILHYFSGPYKDFLQVLLMEYEIYDIVLILRKIARGENVDEIEAHFVHSENYSDLPYEKLASSKSVSQFIENLKNTRYYIALKTLTGGDALKREFHIEMKLHLLYYKTLLKRTEKLSGADSKIAEELIGLRIDFLNIQWIYRAKKHYNISPEEMLNYSLQGGRKLSFDRLRKLCYAKSIDEIKQLSKQYLRVDIFTSDHRVEIDRNIDQAIFKFVKGKKYEGTIGTVLSYVYILESAIRQFIAITEGIRYKLPREQMQQYLIRTR